MTVTETTTTSWGSRIGSAFGGIFVGLVLVLASIVGLFWNEGRTVDRYKALKEGNKVVVSVQADKVDPANEGKLIHLSGQTASDDILCDDDFGVSVKAVYLSRSAEMYQWEEKSSQKKQKKLGGGEETVTTYSYSKSWSSTLLDSSSYKEQGHDNPSDMPYTSKEYYASDVQVGAFKLSPALVRKLGSSEEFKVSDPSQQQKAADPAKVPATDAQKTDAQPAGEPNKSTVPETKKTSYEAKPADGPIKLVSYLVEDSKTSSVLSTGGSISVGGNTAVNSGSTISVQPNNAGTAANNSQGSISVTTDASQTAVSRDRKYVNGMIYIGKDPSVPEIGDIRIRYLVVYPGKDVSIVSQQQGNSFVPYTAKKGKIELLKNEVSTADAMFSDAQSSNKLLGWVIRIIGFVVMCFGFGMIMRPIAVLADVVPFFGNIAETGTGIISFLLSFALTSATIGVAWLFYRPLFGVPLLVLAVYILFVMFKKKKNVGQK